LWPVPEIVLFFSSFCLFKICFFIVVTKNFIQIFYPWLLKIVSSTRAAPSLCSGFQKGASLHFYFSQMRPRLPFPLAYSVVATRKSRPSPMPQLELPLQHTSWFCVISVGSRAE